jgi:hypothetical protein
LRAIWQQRAAGCYNFNMSTQEAIIEELLEPVADAMTPETARLFADFRTPPTVQARVDALAKKCNEGQLSLDERTDYDNYVRIGNLLALLKARARQVIANAANS